MALPDATEPFPRVVIGYMSVRPKNGKSVLQEDDLSDYESFYGDDTNFERTRTTITDHGLEVIEQSPFGFAVAGTKAQWENLQLGTLKQVERLLYGSFGRPRSVTHVNYESSRQDGVGARIPEQGELAESVDAVVFERPRAALSLSATPPAVDRFHLTLPDRVAQLLGADGLGHRGDGVRVAMVDTGWFRHPFFAANGYKVEDPVSVVPDTDPLVDPYGHGTGVAANVFATAPDATLVPIRAADDAGHLVGTLAGFMRAKKLGVHVITNSWSGDYPYPDFPVLPLPADRMLELEIRHAINALKIAVVFAGGNGTFAVEAQIPGVISAGGVYVDEQGALAATTYASGFPSPWFRGATDPVKVPTVCGLVGLPPRASYLMLPVPPGSPVDRDRAIDAQGDPADGTTAEDGWALFSGTSSAAPQVAGAVAVLRGIHPDATPLQIAEQLSTKATDIGVGRSHPRFGSEAVRDQADVATGYGLVNVGQAVENWPPPPPRRLDRATTGDDFITELVDQGKIECFLERLAGDDAFRKALETDARAALLDFGLDEPFTVVGTLTCAPPAECLAALQAFRAGNPFDVIDKTGQLARMLH